MTKREKETNGTTKKFVEGIEKSIHLRRYFKPKDTYFGGIQRKATFLAGWRVLPDEERDGEQEDVCGDDTSTVVDTY
jgi:hypothetical protein